jgi:transcription elongation factor S-II
MTAALRDLFKGVCTEEEVQLLERCIYNTTIRRANERHVGRTWSHKPFGELYRMIAKTIAANFHPSSYVKNTELFERWRAGETSFEDICNMDSYQMFEARWRDNFVAQQAQEKRQLEGNRAMATDRFTCTRCWKKECTYYEMQTRSADEPMTIFITCLNCGKHWRQ